MADVNRSRLFDRLVDEHSDICLIVGCQRSGTTLMHLILECHSGISCHDEPTSYDYFADETVLEGELREQKSLGKRVLAFKCPCLTEQFDNTDGVARDISYHKFPFPFRYNNHLVLFLVRDPRDVCLSLKRLKTNPRYSSWANSWEGYVDSLYPETIPGFNEKYAGDLSIIKNAGEFSFAAKVALYWKIKTESFFRYDEMGYKLRLILYEDLCTSPERNIRHICRFLKIPFDTKMLNHHLMEHKYVDENGYAIGDTDPYRSIDPDAIRLYDGKMPLKEQKIIFSIAGPTYKKIQRKWIQQLRNLTL